MNTKNIHQTVFIKAAPRAVYRALMDPRQHSKITGSKAVIGAKTGGSFSMWDGGIHGITLLLVPDAKIVQAWRSHDWPDDHYSVASFSLQKAGNGTRLVFDQYGVPARDSKSISEGWKTYYWKPMKELLEKGR
ncbi:MAG TPA: SRPBCC family protein [Nitrospirota bacterium]|nr:SRPBCC family protein [Nitrospirota bacterium]